MINITLDCNDNNLFFMGTSIATLTLSEGVQFLDLSNDNRENLLQFGNTMQLANFDNFKRKIYNSRLGKLLGGDEKIIKMARLKLKNYMQSERLQFTTPSQEEYRLRVGFIINKDAIVKHQQAMIDYFKSFEPVKVEMPKTVEAPVSTISPQEENLQRIFGQYAIGTEFKISVLNDTFVIQRFLSDGMRIRSNFPMRMFLTEDQISSGNCCKTLRTKLFALNKDFLVNI